MPENKKQKHYFDLLNEVNVNEYTQKKGNFTYLSWAWAVRELLKVDPEATWEVHEYENVDGTLSPYMLTEVGYFVKVTVWVGGIARSQTHPVLDNRNQTIEIPNAFQINTSIQRCLAKAIALHGLGLYIYAGEDLPQYIPLTKGQVKDILAIAEKLGTSKYEEVALGIDNQLVHSENYDVTLKSLERRVEQSKEKVEAGDFDD